MPAKAFQGWVAYAEVEPFDERWMDDRFASIVTTLMNIHRDPNKHPFGFKLEEGRLPLLKPPKPTTQTEEDHIRFLSMLAGVVPEEPTSNG